MKTPDLDRLLAKAGQAIGLANDEVDELGWAIADKRTPGCCTRPRPIETGSERPRQPCRVPCPWTCARLFDRGVNLSGITSKVQPGVLASAATVVIRFSLGF